MKFEDKDITSDIIIFISKGFNKWYLGWYLFSIFGFLGYSPNIGKYIQSLNTQVQKL
jgi:hypothetical protein